ncbi:unnamed protein product [Schistosoma curassoni]|uniref:SWIM-type domain-containing protein n=1 Tax=Schistosoma curassoni TaxID=6186 RepID=A0A183KU43_9TREM|nr:unnamed protein product [Schistosoma curassoni]
MTYVVDTSPCERFDDYMPPCGHILYAHPKDLIHGDVFRYNSRLTRKYITDFVLRTLDNMPICTGTVDPLERFINKYHSIRALSESLASKIIRSCLEESEDLCAQALSSVGDNYEAPSSQSTVFTDHSYAS